MKTVTELAKELGISRQALDKRIRRIDVAIQLSTRAGIVQTERTRFISPDGEKIIKDSYNVKNKIRFEKRTNNLYQFNKKMMYKNKYLRLEMGELTRKHLFERASFVAQLEKLMKVIREQEKRIKQLESVEKE